jgi:hypothetical protein
MNGDSPRSNHTAFTLTIYWACILLGLAIPPVATIGVDILKHDQSFWQAVHQWQIHLFAPGYNLFLVMVMNTVPFVLLALFSLFHLGSAGHTYAGLTRRKSGVLVAAIAATGLSLWTHVMTLWHPDAQGALAYVFLPFVLAVIVPLSYLAGWGAAYMFRQTSSEGPVSS